MSLYNEAKNNLGAALAGMKVQSAQDLKNAGYSEQQKLNANFMPPKGDVGGGQPPYAIPEGADVNVLNPSQMIQLGLALSGKRPIPEQILNALMISAQRKLAADKSAA